MSASKHPATDPPQTPASDARVVTMITCPGVRSLTRQDADGAFRIANENTWFDRISWKRRWYANIAGAVLATALLVGGFWIVSEFVRLQKIAECFEAGRTNCIPLDMSRRSR